MTVRGARADSGASDDPRDSSSKIDIRRVSHTNDDETATYRVEMYESFDLDDLDGLTWEFDFNNDGTAAEACALLRPIGTTGILRASFAKDCGPETWATSDATIEDRAIEFSLPLIDLVEGGGLRAGEPYSYRVTTRDSAGVEDTAPDQQLAVHEDVPAPTARPGSGESQPGFEGVNVSRDSGVGGEGAPSEGGSEGAGEGAAAGSEGSGAEGVDFRFGPVPVCSGGWCFAVGVGAPVAAFALFRVGLGVISRRRRGAEGANGHAPAAADARSHPGNV